MEISTAFFGMPFLFSSAKLRGAMPRVAREYMARLVPYRPELEQDNAAVSTTKANRALKRSKP